MSGSLYDTSTGLICTLLFLALLLAIEAGYRIGRRLAPEFALWVLSVTVVLAHAIVGYASGIAGHRVSIAGYIMAALVVVLVFVILDLDRPRRGLIEVSNEPIVAVYASMQAHDATRK